VRAAFKRKTSPKVIGGLVQRKNNHTPTGQEGYVVDRERPARGFRHVLKKKDVHDFTDLIPNWPKHSIGLEAIILAAGDSEWDGLYRFYSREQTGMIRIAAWPDSLLTVSDYEFIENHDRCLNAFGVVRNRVGTKWHCQFTEAQARAYSLLHVFLHELGHHIHRTHGRRRTKPGDGESFAENYANEAFEAIWPSYVRRCGAP
jgi:hypothetical protein